ncbi:conserved hypothetical protein [Roseibium sp. TrichSKD4]|uniref:DUF2730 family protein n=1 Tax=Roseibium sp. TrichSKD4 TaxID=744980 RepID=UPI0001E57067|nr:DUF2730 family protein [Roseibium sp. TrichSKD4]EFO31660.1 conserved hypothetical protein [Roseibium sp. TrichSKD4]
MFEWIKGLDAAFGLVGAFAGSLALFVSWITRGSKANAVSIAKLEAEHNDLCGRVSELEGVIHNQPTKDDFHKLEMAITEMNGKVATVSTELAAVGRIAKRIDDFLLTKGGRL